MEDLLSTLIAILTGSRVGPPRGTGSAPIDFTADTATAPQAISVRGWALVKPYGGDVRVVFSTTSGSPKTADANTYPMTDGDAEPFYFDPSEDWRVSTYGIGSGKLFIVPTEADGS